jgi:transposase
MTNYATTTIGMDLGDTWTVLCVLDESGEMVEQSRVRTRRKEMLAHFTMRSPARVVLEVGTHSPWVSRLLEELGHEVIVANSRRVRAIAESQKKTDENDAELLARLGRVDPKLLAPLAHRKEETQADLVVLRARDVLVKARTMLVTSVRNQVKSLGERLPRRNPGSFHKLAEESPKKVLAKLAPTMKSIEQLNEQIGAYDEHIEQLIEEKYPEAAHVSKVDGVGPITALTYVLTVEDPRRFRSSRDVGPYLGLTRRRRQSGDEDPELKISKAGDGFLRRLLVQCAHYIIGPLGKDCALRRWGLKLVGQGGRGAKKRAAVAVARKLAVLLHRLWVTGEDYRPFPAHAPGEGEPASSARAPSQGAPASPAHAASEAP